MLISPELTALFNSLGPYVIQIGGLIISYLALSAKNNRDKLEQQALHEKEKAAAKQTADELAAAALEKARARLDERNKELMDGVIEKNTALEESVNRLREIDDKRREADVKKDELVVNLQAELRATAVDCKTQIEKVMAEMAIEMNKLRESLGIALESKGRAEGTASVLSAASIAPTNAPASSPTPAESSTGQVAKGTVAISLDVVPKQE